MIFSSINSKCPDDFKHLIGNKISDIILFDDGNDELLEYNIILPRHYYIFEGNKDGEINFKPYKNDPYRIVVSTYKDIIIDIESIG